jgi:hypothetical protein
MDNHEFTRLTAKLLEIPEFAVLSDKQFRTLVLFADYKSPFRQKPKEDRFRLAALEAGYSVDSGKQNQLEKIARDMLYGNNKKWNAALEKYMAIQHDDDREVLDMVDAQMDNIRKMIATPAEDEASLEKRNKLILSLPGLIETKRKISRMVGKEEELMGNTQEESGEKVVKSLVDEVNEELMNQKQDDL